MPRSASQCRAWACGPPASGTLIRTRRQTVPARAGCTDFNRTSKEDRRPAWGDDQGCACTKASTSWSADSTVVTSLRSLNGLASQASGFADSARALTAASASRGKDAADAQALEYLERRVDAVALPRQIDIHQFEFRPAVHGHLHRFI